MRKPQQPIVEKRVIGGHDAEVLKHPAFAQISASRVTGSQPCYGSDFQHQGFIELELRYSEHHRQFNGDDFVPRDTIVRAHMSEVQFASFVTSLNTGSSVCVTLDELSGRPIPELPRPEPEKSYRVQAEGALADMVARLKRLDEKVDEVASSLSKSDRETLMVEVRRARRDIDEVLPFVQAQLDRRMREHVERAKVEISNYASSAMQRMGVDAIQAARRNMDAALGRKT